MSPQRYPNADYPTPWDEANMKKATDVVTNRTGAGLAVESVPSGQGPLKENEVKSAKNAPKTEAPKAKPKADK